MSSEESSIEDSSHRSELSRTSILEDTGLCEYLCEDCREIFIGVIIPEGLRCPECHSLHTRMNIIYEENG